MVQERDERVEISTRTLVESMLGEDGTIDASGLYAVAETLGMGDEQVRLCVRRLVRDGRFVQEGRGRRAVLRATAQTRRVLEPEIEFVRLMYAQDRGEAPWDGLWHLAAFAVPESARAARDALRDAIVYLGGAPLQGGLYVAANPWEELVESEAARLGVGEHLTLLTSTDLRVGGVRDPRTLAARLWPLAGLADGHRRLARIARERLERLAEPAALDQVEFLTMTLELSAGFTQAMEPDPLLPPELLPRPWPGVEARALVARCWARLLQHPGSGSAPRLFGMYAQVVKEVTTI